MKAKLIFFSFLLFPFLVSVACTCPPLEAISKEQVEIYDLVFLGTVDSISPCEGKSIAYFSVQELYRGKGFNRMEVYFDCSSSCQMSLQKGEQWLVYAEYEKYGQTLMGFCSRSRKFFSNPSVDYYKASGQLGFAEELEFLRKNFGLQSLKQADDNSSLQRDLVKPKGLTSLWLLLGSLAGFLIIYFIFKKKLK